MSKFRPDLLLLTCAIACRTSGDPRPAIEPGIARALAARFGAPAVVACGWIGRVAVGCRATFEGGSALVIAIDGRQWRVAGRAVATAPITAYLSAELADLGRHDAVDCGPPVHAGVEPIACTLSGGGLALVDIAADGTASIELALDPAVAAVRTEIPRDDLERLSRALDIAGEDGDDGKNVK